MKHLQLNCGKCKRLMSLPLPESIVNSTCPSCDTGIQVMTFPSLVKESTPGKAGKTLFVDDESSCFYHPTKQAEIPCDGCGRFLCSLCDIDFQGEHLCPVCFEKGSQKGKLERLQNRRILYDELALFLAIIPVLFFCVTILTAPAALFVSIRYWKAPLSIVRKSRWRFVAAAVFSGLELLLWGVYAIFIFGALSQQ
jgi:hypothetical protein